jgi:hypothetical protein
LDLPNKEREFAHYLFTYINGGIPPKARRTARRTLVDSVFVRQPGNVFLDALAKGGGISAEHLALSRLDASIFALYDYLHLGAICRRVFENRIQALAKGLIAAQGFPADEKTLSLCRELNESLENWARKCAVFAAEKYGARLKAAEN